MASFRTHISFGVFLGAAAVIALVSFAFVPFEFNFLGLVLLAAILGAIVPDMDSDSGIPFHLAFASLSFISGALALIYVWQEYPGDVRIILGIPGGVALFVWVVLGKLFKKFTVHRGMAHSIPAALLSSCLLFSLAVHAGFDSWKSFLLGISFGGGYILHLVLDEVCSAVNFHGTLFVPNKALGSALKLFSQSSGANIFVYGALVLVFLDQHAVFLENGRKLVEIFR